MYSSLMTMFRRSRRRSEADALAQLDDRLLADIGLTRGDVSRLRNGRLQHPRVWTHE